MALLLAALLRDARLDALETHIGVDPDVVIYDGNPAPTNADAVATGTALVTIPNLGDWLTAASGGSKSKNGTWSASASNSGTARYFRVLNSSGVCKIQGACSAAGGGGDMILDNTSISSGQTVTVTAFVLNEAAHAGS